jgi:hypothetical protein
MAQRGIQLGLLSSSFQLNSILYHTKSEFWGAIRFSRPCSVQDIAMTTLLLLSFILASLAGPSSAIVMVPKLDWFDPPRGLGAIEVTIDSDLKRLFPGSVNRSIIADHCFWSNATSFTECPSAGFSSILNSGFANPLRAHAEDLIVFSGPTVGVTTPGGIWRRTVNLTGSTITAGSSTPDFISSAFAHLLLNPFIEANKSSPYFALNRLWRDDTDIRMTVGNRLSSTDPISNSPLGVAICGHTSFGSSQLFFPRSAFDGNYSNSSPAINAFITESSIISKQAQDGLHGKANFSWIDLPAPNAPLAGVFAMGSSRENVPGYIVTCVLEGAWVRSQFRVSPAAESISNTLNDLGSGMSESILQARQPIKLEISWAEALDVKLENVTGNYTTMETLGTECLQKILGHSARQPLITQDKIRRGISYCIERGLALFLTDGLARIQASAPQTFTGVPDPAAVASQARGSDLITRIPFYFEYYGYGYSLRGTTIKLAFTVLLLHAVIVIVHISLMLRSRKSSRTWDHVGDFIALAMNSKPSSYLKNTGGGVGKAATWALRVRVKVGEDNALGLVVEDDPIHRGKWDKSDAIASGKKYA